MDFDKDTHERVDDLDSACRVWDFEELAGGPKENWRKGSRCQVAAEGSGAHSYSYVEGT